MKARKNQVWYSPGRDELVVVDSNEKSDKYSGIWYSHQMRYSQVPTGDSFTVFEFDGTLDDKWVFHQYHIYIGRL